MKKRTHIITRIALAATIFTTTLGGVAPMTALAAETATAELTLDTTKIHTVELNAGSGGNVSAADNTNFGTNRNYNLPTPTTTVKGKKFSKWTGSLTDTISKLDTDGKVLTIVDADNDQTSSLSASWVDGSGVNTVTVSPDTFTKGSNTNVTVTITVDGYQNLTDTLIIGTENYTITNFGWDSAGTTATISIPAATLNNLAASTTPYDIVATALVPSANTNSAKITISNPTYTFTATPSVNNISAGTETPVTINVTSSPASSEVVTFGSLKLGGVDVATTNYDIVSAGKGVYLHPDYIKSLPTGNNSFSFKMSNGQDVSTTLTIGNAATGEKKSLKSITWASGSTDVLGSISTGITSQHPDDGSTKTENIHDVGTKEITHTSTLTLKDIQDEIKKAKKVIVKLDGVGDYPEDVTWNFDYKFGSNKEASTRLNSSNYSTSKTSEQTFYVYSDRISYSEGDKYNVDGMNYFRLKLKVVVSEKTTDGSGTGNVSAPTFSPASGAYVYPGAKIAFSSTTSGVSFRSQSGDTKPTTSSGTQGSTIAIPSGATAGTYKLNAIAYTSTSAYSDVATASYTVVTNSTAYQITEGSGQTVSQSVPAAFTGSGDLGSFKALYVDDTFVPETWYTKSSGSTIITLSPTYLQTLTAGNHTVKMVFTDGYATGNFTLTAGGGATPINPNDANSGSYSGGGRAYTGTDDRSQIVIMFVLLGMLIAGFAVSVYYKNEKLRKNRYMD